MTSNAQVLTVAPNGRLVSPLWHRAVSRLPNRIPMGSEFADNNQASVRLGHIRSIQRNAMTSGEKLMTKATNIPEQSSYVFRGLSGARENFFPYCLDLQVDGRWQLLNRNYQPIGCRTYDKAGNKVMQFSFHLRGLGPATQAKLCVHGEGGRRIYLYNDGCLPTFGKKNTEMYLTKLGILLPMDTREERP